jgi:hypothetical protein
MAKIYLKKVDSGKIGICDGCYFHMNDNDCPSRACGKKELICGDFHIFKKITERTAKKLLKSGWRVAR